MKYFLLYLCVFISNLPFAQISYTFIEYNNVAARINNSGRWFFDLDNSNGYIIPKNEGVSSIYSTSLIMGGIGTDGNLKLAASIFGEGQDYYVGPIADNSSSLLFNSRYNRLWKISKSEIITHQAAYMQAGYVMPSDIESWPGNGNASNGESHLLAPFVDLNGDGIYSPQHGDYPEIRGDQAVYFILNDYNGEHTEWGGEHLGVEIHAMTYVYSVEEESPINNCVFIHLDIRKKAGSDLSDFYLSVFNDFDLGAYNDDYIGTDSLRNMVYVYNGQTVDLPVSGSIGYGNHVPAQGCMFMNQTIAKSIYWMIAGSPNNFAPTNASHLYNSLKGLWNDGAPITNPFMDENGTPMNFMFTGNPETNTGWTEALDNNAVGDRRILMSCGPFNFSDGESFCVDIAFPFARGTVNANPALAVGELRQSADVIQEFYDSFSYHCLNSIVSVKENELKPSGFSIYPNPSRGEIAINSDKEIQGVEVFDILGKCIYKKNNLGRSIQHLKVELNNADTGVYLIKLSNLDGSVFYGKMIVE